MFQTSIIRAWAVVADAELGQDRVHVLGLDLGLGMGDVAHVEDQVGLEHLLERRAECGDELVRQVGDETHRVGEDGTLATSGSAIARIVGSSVAKSMSLASTPEPVRRLKSVDLPALV